jgi:hypothetical protein
MNYVALDATHIGMSVYYTALKVCFVVDLMWRLRAWHVGIYNALKL